MVNPSSVLRSLHEPIVVAAFSGWSDAGTAASDAVDHLAETYNAEQVFALDPDDFYDFQVTRPVVTRSGGEARFTWPTTEVMATRIADRDVILVAGPEPSYRWDGFCRVLTEMLAPARPKLALMLGALLADVLHNRPLPSSVTSQNPDLQRAHGLIGSDYEGPTGITGIFSHRLELAGIPVASAWVSVPHYVASTPNPKAALTLLRHVEDISELHLDLADLPELARAWERSANEVAESDPAISEYVAALAEEQDEAELPQASGDAIAAEFERYLRRREA
ncbi:PAC2 family protein [Enemella sp. A6]|uniref:PAC2 family protein n=1 Tax=Enemella sp. A6 TaxID=3440152 RepID=UPI003EB78BBF